MCTPAQAEKGKGAMGNLINLMKVIISNPLDLQSLRATYSFDLCGLIASMVAKEREGRPALCDVLRMPLLQAQPQGKALASLGGDQALLSIREGSDGVFGAATTWLQQLVV